MITDVHNIDDRFKRVLTHTVCLRTVVITRKMVQFYRRRKMWL